MDRSTASADGKHQMGRVSVYACREWLPLGNTGGETAWFGATAGRGTAMGPRMPATGSERLLRYFPDVPGSALRYSGGSGERRPPTGSDRKERSTHEA